MLDVSALARMVTSLLAPSIPYLLKGGEQAWEEASRKIGTDTWELTKAIWTRLVSGSKLQPDGNDKTIEVIKAATEVAHSPSDEDAKAALRLQIKKLLTNDPELGVEIEKFLNEVKNSSAQTNIRIGGVDIFGQANVTNQGNIVGGNQIISN